MTSTGGRLFLLMLAAAATAAYSAVPPGEADRQYRILQHDLNQRANFESRAAQVVRPDSLILSADRDPLDVILRRTLALANHLKTVPQAPDLSGAESELKSLREKAEAMPVTDVAARRTLFDQACEVRRRIAFANPLLNFDKLVFMKRHRALCNHMCDQYYGMAARPGGGLYVLSKPFSDAPVVENLLKDAVVGNGRLKGQKLEGGSNRQWKIGYDGEGNATGEVTEGGSFLSPDISFDAKQLLFAYVECRDDQKHRHHTDPSQGHWAEGRCYHVFRVNLDGSDLTQLTDGTFNDFDPCWMPSGRIALTSERRGGYLRCGRTCPTFTVFDMADDGSDIRCLSFHETNEWHPSVTHDGMIVFTRWDYVDRNAMVAHHPWTMTPDGRDPRAMHGNFTPRNTRPDMELDVRSIPGSHRFVATAAPHHGHSFGSLVTVDPRAPDDEAMSAVRRITPDVGFPESQRGTETYGEPWPLNEDFYLCSYGPEMEVKGLGHTDRYGLYLVDSFGNKELIYRDPDIGCHNPVPLVARTKPPIIAEASVRVPADQDAEATVAVMNVYQSQKPWPEGTIIKALRVYHAIPMSVPSGRPPHDIGMRADGTSVNTARALLGTVPVESDGSAYFTVPARRELFFQALDEKGLAVTSMRSATQFQPGETASCQGCHERRQGAPEPARSTPLATRRPPSRLQPDVDGTNPFSYPRLIQPLLDKHCVACHAKQAGKAPALGTAPVHKPAQGWIHPINGFYESYLNLVPKYGFYRYPEPLETTPGKFGARVAPLYALLTKGHHGVKLTREELHRFSVWLDACSPFYGVYEKEGGDAQFRGGIARPSL
jgi:hypothetical protein